jgi:fluoride ion exporter CrcB/FEX
MEETITFEPIFWRLVIWRSIPALIGSVIGSFIYKIINPYSSFPFTLFIISVLAISILGSIIFGKKFDVVISENKISGISTGMVWSRKTFLISDLDKSSIHKQSVYEKISGVYVLRARNGQKIIIAHFVYGSSAVNKIRKILE